MSTVSAGPGTDIFLDECAYLAPGQAEALLALTDYVDLEKVFALFGYNQIEVGRAGVVVINTVDGHYCGLNAEGMVIIAMPTYACGVVYMTSERRNAILLHLAEQEQEQDDAPGEADV